MTENNFANSDVAVAVLLDSSYPEFEREQAAIFLQDHPSTESIQALIQGLDEDDYGVHWACGTAIAFLGEKAFHYYLETLARADHSARQREAARHIVHYNSSEKVKQDGKALLLGIKGPSPAIGAMEEANKLLLKYR